MVDKTPADNQTLLDKMSDIALQKLGDADNDLLMVEEPYRTVAIIYAAQGVIDNGGLVYFFENDWPGQPPYSVFADAYEGIGRAEAANAIRSAVLSFGFQCPEKERDKRRLYMTQHYNKRTYSVDGWNDCICGDDQVWSDLARWIRTFPAR